MILSLIKDGRIPIANKEKAEEYIKRAEAIRAQSNFFQRKLKNITSSFFHIHCAWYPIAGTSKSSTEIKTQEQLSLERAEFLMYQALDEDEVGHVEEALTLYTQAIELCISTVGCNHLMLLKRKHKYNWEERGLYNSFRTFSFFFLFFVLVSETKGREEYSTQVYKLTIGLLMVVPCL